ncbi:MAG: fatty acid hydroxylase [Planctomycetota bacterium]
MLALLAVAAGAFAAVFAYSSFFEWALHRFLMHRPLLIRYPYRTHALTHHRIFRADASFVLSRPEDVHEIRFAVWNAPLLIGLHIPPLWLLGHWTGLPVLVPGLAAMSVYYGLYESLHYFMHAPKGRRIEGTAVFRWLRAHHWGHHRRHDRNLNVVFPLADLLFRTLLPWTPIGGLVPAAPGARRLRGEGSAPGK